MTSPDLPAIHHPAALAPDRLLSECDLRFTRRSGPGGQNRNKVETAVVVTHRDTGISAEANERRSQHENREVALFRLRVNLAIEVRSATPTSETTHDVPSPLWKSRCRDGRIVINPAHDDFPAMLAEALDAVWVSEFEIRAAAQRLTCTPSQLVKFLKLSPRAMTRINAEREGRGLHRLQ